MIFVLSIGKLYFPSFFFLKKTVKALQEIDLIEAIVTHCKYVWFMPRFPEIYKWVQNVVQAPGNKPPSYLLPP